MGELFHEADISKKERTLEYYSKNYDTEDFNNRINSIKKETGLTYKEMAKQMGISERYFRMLRNQPDKHKSVRVNREIIEKWEDTFPLWYPCALIHKFSPKHSLDWVEIEVHAFRNKDEARNMFEMFDDMYAPINNTDLMEKFLTNNPLKAAGKLRYWLNHHDVLNFRETHLFISDIERGQLSVLENYE